MSEDNGRDRDERRPNGRVRFGNAPGNEIPTEWAEPLLQRLWAANREFVGKHLLELTDERVLGGLGLTAGRRRKARSRS